MPKNTPCSASIALGKAMQIAQDYIPALRHPSAWTVNLNLGMTTGQLDLPNDPFLIGPPLSLVFCCSLKALPPLTAWLLAGKQRLLTTTLALHPTPSETLDDLNGYLTLVWSKIYASDSGSAPSPRRLYTLTKQPPPTQGQQWPKWPPGTIIETLYPPLLGRFRPLPGYFFEKPLPSGITWKIHQNLPSWIASGIIQPA